MIPYLGDLSRWADTLRRPKRALVVWHFEGYRVQHNLSRGPGTGGVTVSYFEWVQDFNSYFWTEDEINEHLDRIMVSSLRKIWGTAEQHHVSLRTATFAVACERILMQRCDRGLYP